MLQGARWSQSDVLQRNLPAGRGARGAGRGARGARTSSGTGTHVANVFIVSAGICRSICAARGKAFSQSGSLAKHKWTHTA
jgi:hypothetical protein